MTRFILVAFLIILLISCNQDDSMKSIYKVMEKTSIASNITYKKIGAIELQLDVYYPAKKLGQEPWEKLSESTKPTLVYFHGGGWIEGDRTSRFLGLIPYLEKNWCVVNVDYRLLHETNLIGCLNDCIDAINWVNDNSSKYKFNTNQIYLSGESAGGHLALLAGLIDEADLGEVKIQKRKCKIRGIINWYGITQMDSAIKFWNDSSYTRIILDNWEGDVNQYINITSPINHISPNSTPPIISIHGDKDVNVEIEQAFSLHKELKSKRIKNKLVKVEGKKHGDFTLKEMESIFNEIWNFFEIQN